MKFFESLYGELVNVEEITKVTLESNGFSPKYHAYVHLRSEEKIDFIELPQSLFVDESKIEREYLRIIKDAFSFILESPNQIIHKEDIQKAFLTG